jgi:hypothetical protein
MLRKLFGKKEEASTPAMVAHPVTTTCVHTVLLPRWDSTNDMGQQDKITRYLCESCHQEFSAAEGKALLEAEADRLRAELVGQDEAEKA